VSVGEQVGLVGMSGVAEGPHLHFEVRLGENAYAATVNPEMWLVPRPGFGVLAGQIVGADGSHPDELRFVLYAAAAPDAPVRDLVTYPATEAVRDPLAQEDFCFGEIEAGQWLIKVYHRSRLYEQPVTIRDGEQSWVSIQLAR